LTLKFGHVTGDADIASQLNLIVDKREGLIGQEKSYRLIKEFDWLKAILSLGFGETNSGRRPGSTP